MLEQQLTPRQIVAELDKYVISQDKAKKSVAIALRNRWRRQMVQEELREEIMPNNIIMIGPTGVGKTEIARRLARLARAPFIKVEATKFTEVGYVGRDVESMIRDLVDLAISMVKSEKMEAVKDKAAQHAEERLLDILLPQPPESDTPTHYVAVDEHGVAQVEEEESPQQRYERSREKMRERLRKGKMDEREIELEVSSDSFPMMQVISPAGVEEMGMNLQDMFGNLFPKKTKKRRMKVKEARELLTAEEAQKLIDQESVSREAIQRVENSGIVFIDEIDKVAGKSQGSGPDVSREGVQRDLLPVVEGTTVVTKHGMVKTDHILFIASGAFHVSKPADLIPELQGRFPIRVELESLTTEDFVRILTEPENALLKQYEALLKAEGVTLEFTEEAVHEIAEIAWQVNERTENIGARRLHTVLSTLLEDILFDIPDKKMGKIVIDRERVREALGSIVGDEDLTRYIL